MSITKTKTANNTIPGALLTGAAAALAWSILCGVITAKLVETEKLNFSAIGYAAMFIHLTASMLAAWIAWHRVRKNRLPVCLGAGGIYYLSLLGITALFFGGIYTGMGTTALMVVAGSVIPALCGAAGKGRRAGHHYKIRTA